MNMLDSMKECTPSLYLGAAIKLTLPSFEITKLTKNQPYHLNRPFIMHPYCRPA